MSEDLAQKLITVVIPAYNAQDTIADTLRSVQSQSHQALEILVVDDGSKDDTAAIVQQFAAADPRIRLVSQANAGVAEARNNGWRQARSDLISFVDADDLWSRDKIELQLAALEAAGPRAGLVYSRYALIDENNRVTYLVHTPAPSGEVLDKLIVNNFVGNGSSALARREAIEAANGFEPALFRAGAQGCEDILFYCRVAEHYEFAAVEDFQIGYRQLPGAMSANLPRMLRSWVMVNDEMLERHPAKKRIIHESLRTYGNWTIRKAIGQRQYADIMKLVGIAGSRSWSVAGVMLFYTVPQAVFRKLRWHVPGLRQLAARSERKAAQPSKASPEIRTQLSPGMLFNA